MPKPPAHQRPMPVNRQTAGFGRPGATIGKAGRTQPPKPASQSAGLRIELKLPGVPKLPGR